jgi:hypothetical protein
LEKIIEREFLKKTSNQDFFEKIGQSLSIRRSFRNWLSEKLLLKDGDIKKHCPRSGLDFIIFLFHNLFLNPRYSNSSLSI